MENITLEQLLEEARQVPERNWPALHIVMQALRGDPVSEADDVEATRAFLDEMYGCTADDPLVRGDQGVFETRLELNFK